MSMQRTCVAGCALGELTWGGCAGTGRATLTVRLEGEGWRGMWGTTTAAMTVGDDEDDDERLRDGGGEVGVSVWWGGEETTWDI